MKEETTSAETQLTGEGPERIWMHCKLGYWFSVADECKEEGDVEYVRADLAINESPKTEVEVLSPQLSKRLIDGLIVERDSLARVNESLVTALQSFISASRESDLTTFAMRIVAARRQAEAALAPAEGTK